MIKYLNLRSLNARMDKLLKAEEELAEVTENYNSEEEESITALNDAESLFDEDDEEELADLRELQAQLGSQFDEDEVLIHIDDFPEHVEDLCVSCGYVSHNLPYFIAIDWEHTAQNVAADYTLVTYAGEEYYIHN